MIWRLKTGLPTITPKSNHVGTPVNCKQGGGGGGGGRNKCFRARALAATAGELDTFDRSTAYRQEAIKSLASSENREIKTRYDLALENRCRPRQSDRKIPLRTLGHSVR